MIVTYWSRACSLLTSMCSKLELSAEGTECSKVEMSVEGAKCSKLELSTEGAMCLELELSIQCAKCALVKRRRYNEFRAEIETWRRDVFKARVEHQRHDTRAWEAKVRYVQRFPLRNVEVAKCLNLRLSTEGAICVQSLNWAPKAPCVQSQSVE